MSYSVLMPELGESITEGTIVRWLKNEGDKITADEPLLEISTDKVDTEIPAPTDGILTKILAQVDEVVNVGSEIAVIDEVSAGTESTTPEETPDTAPSAETSVKDNKDIADTSVDTSVGSPAETELVMPELGECITEGTIVRWLKNEGDKITADEPLLEISTDKVDTEIPAPTDGILTKIKAKEDEIVAVGAVLALIGNQEQGSTSSSPQTNNSEDSTTAVIQDEMPTKQESGSEKSTETTSKHAVEDVSNNIIPQTITYDNQKLPYVTPLVRKIATENNVDLNNVHGTGVGGRIRKQDVLAAITTTPTNTVATNISSTVTPNSPLDYTKLPGVRPELASLKGTNRKINKIREITAKKTRESLQTTAQLTQTFEIDLTTVVKERTKLKQLVMEKYGFNLTYLHIIAYAVVKVLEQHPNINASINEDTKEITYHKDINLGIAVDTDEGLLSPVVHEANSMSLLELGQAIADLAKRTRENNLKPNELFGGTFTITNIGSQGALFDTPILVPPQGGMLGTGNIIKRPMVLTAADKTESIAIRNMMYTPLTYDHRLIDGADAGRFLSSLKYLLEHPDFLNIS